MDNWRPATPAILFHVGVLLLIGTGDVLGQGGQPSPRTAWGSPDLGGIWNHGTATPLERPDQYEGRDQLTDAEVAAINAEARSTEGVGARRAVWWERGFSDGRTSMIVDPPDGRIPYTASASDRRESWTGLNADGPEGRNLWERCITAGIPRLGGAYSQNIHLFQTPGHVALLYEMIHEYRIVPIDKRPPLASGIRQWLGDGRGRWDGDTLVVETANFDDRQLFRQLSQGATRLIERFTRLGDDRLRYSVTFENPSQWNQSWTATLDMPRTEGPVFEYACQEGNRGMTNVLEIARLEDMGRTGIR